MQLLEVEVLTSHIQSDMINVMLSSDCLQILIIIIINISAKFIIYSKDEFQVITAKFNRPGNRSGLGILLRGREFNSLASQIGLKITHARFAINICA